jgi:hypothetical protein
MLNSFKSGEELKVGEGNGDGRIPQRGRSCFHSSNCNSLSRLFFTQSEFQIGHATCHELDVESSNGANEE